LAVQPALRPGVVQAAEILAIEPPGTEMAAAEAPAVEEAPVESLVPEAPALSGSVAEMVARAVAMWPVADQARATVAPPLVKAAGVAAPVMVAPADHTPPTEPEPAPAGPAPEPEPEVSQAEARAARAPEPEAPEAEAPAVRAPEPAAPEVEVPAATVPAVSQPVPLHAAEQASRPVVTVTAEPSRPLRVVERALNGPSSRRTDGWHEHVVVVPGGHRPGRPDRQQRDRARARLAVAGSRRIVVLGCTVGAGQTMTTLMTGEMLARLRADPVAVLDLNPGAWSLAERARTVPALDQNRPPRTPDSGHSGQAGRPAPSRLDVITANPAEARGDRAEEDLGRMFELISARYPLTLADPAAAAVPRMLAVADQLVLASPASADAARSL